MAVTGGLARAVVLVGNPHAGHIKHGLERTRRALADAELPVLETVHMHDLERLRYWSARAPAERIVIVAAGGDGTVGGVVNYLANTGAVLGIVPLGTSNDVARSLGIPRRIEDAVRLLIVGKVSTVDTGRFTPLGAGPRYFVHAASIGLDVAFARLATRVSLRKRLGRLTYIIAMAVAVGKRRPFTCELTLEGRQVRLCILHLSVINAPVFGGLFGLRLRGSDVDDRRLDVLVLEDVPLHRLALAAVPVLFQTRLKVGGVRVYHVDQVAVQSAYALPVSLDGELNGAAPGEFVLVPEGLRVVTPQDFNDVDDAPGV